VFLDFTAFNDETLVQEFKKISGGRGVYAMIMTNAANKAYEQALKFSKPQGTLVCIGIPEGEPVPIQSAFPASSPRINSASWVRRSPNPASVDNKVSDKTLI
jgi:D-arabinose 1-dehydrogenase-like Zn-dependent alcohol dehydrogenase